MNGISSISTQAVQAAAVPAPRPSDQEAPEPKSVQQVDAGVETPVLAPDVEASVQEIKSMVDDVNRVQAVVNAGVRFNVIEDINMVSIQVIDPETDEVIREIPTKAIQQARRSLMEMQEALGIVVDEKQ